MADKRTVTLQLFNLADFQAAPEAKNVYIVVKADHGGKFKTNPLPIGDAYEFGEQMDLELPGDKTDVSIRIKIKSDKKMFGSHSYGEVTVPLKEIGAKGPKKRWDFGTGSALVAGVKCNRPLAAAAGAEGAEGTEGTDTLTSLPSEGNEGKSKKRFSFTSRERSQSKDGLESSGGGSKTFGSLASIKNLTSRNKMVMINGTLQEIELKPYSENGVALYDVIADREANPYDGPRYVPTTGAELRAAFDAAVQYAEGLAGPAADDAER